MNYVYNVSATPPKSLCSDHYGTTILASSQRLRLDIHMSVVKRGNRLHEAPHDVVLMDRAYGETMNY